MRLALLAFLACVLPTSSSTAQSDLLAAPSASGTRNIEVGQPFLTCFEPKEIGGDFQTWDFIQDHRGVLYAGNNRGLLEYDGATWRMIETEASVIRSIAVDASGRLFLGSFGNVGYVAPDASGDLKYVSLLEHIPEEDRTFNDVWTTYATPGGVYFQARERLFRLTETSDGWDVTVWHPIDRFMYAFWVRDEYYVAQASVGLMKMVDDRLELLPGGEFFANDRTQVMVPFEENGEELFLVGSFSLGLHIFDGRSFRPFPTEIDPILQNTTLYKGVLLPDGTFGLLTTESGFFVIDRSGRLLARLDQSSGLLGATMTDAYVDHSGQLWLSSNGICHVEMPSPLTRFTVSQGLQGAVSGLTRHRGVLYASTDTGIYYLDPSTNRFELVSGMRGNRQAFGFLKKDDTLLAASNGGLYEVDGTHARLIRPDVAGDFAALVLHQSRVDPSYVFAGLGDGVAVMQSGVAGEWTELGHLDGVHEYVTHIIEPEPGTLWIGTIERGVLRVTYSADLEITVERFGSEQGIFGEGGISVFQTSSGPLFVASDRIFRFDEAESRFVHAPEFDDLVEFGSTQDEYSIVEVADKNLWINFGAESALVIRDPEGKLYAEKTALMRFADQRASVIFPEENGVVWFGGYEGLIRYDPHISKEYPTSYPALIRRVIIGEDSLLYGGAGRTRPWEAPRIDFGLNSMRFAFSAISFENSRANRYRSMLEGFDHHWSPWTFENRRDYTNLPPGDYTFRVQAQNVYGLTSAEAVFPLTILSPWYRSWWAYLLYAIAAGALIAAVVRGRTRQLQLRQRVLERTVAQRTAQLKQRVEELDTVNHISRALVSQLEFDALVHLVGEQMRETFKADIVYVALYDRETNMLHFPYEYGDYNPSRPFGSGLTEKIITTREPLLVNQDLSEVRRQIQAENIGKQAASYLGVPIMAGEDAIGVISVQSTADENRFDDNDLRLLSTIASNVGVALQNAEAYQRLNAALENLRTTQEQLVHQEKMASLGALTAGIAHEIKNPLNFINNFAALNVEYADELDEELRASGERTVEEVRDELQAIVENLRGNARLIHQHSKRADGIVRSMMQHASGGVGERRPVDVNALVGEYVDLAYHGKRAQSPGFNVEIVRDFDEGVGSVEMVPHEIGRVVLNLVSNAFDAVQDRSHDGDSAPRVAVSTRRLEDGVEIRVQDNGPGVPPEIRERIFEPFFTTKAPGSGTGLGLSLSYDIVRNGHGGTLTVESTDRKGSTFVISLPGSSPSTTRTTTGRHSEMA